MATLEFTNEEGHIETIERHPNLIISVQKLKYYAVMSLLGGDAAEETEGGPKVDVATLVLESYQGRDLLTLVSYHVIDEPADRSKMTNYDCKIDSIENVSI